MQTLQDLATTNFQRWNDALQTKDPEQVAALYTQDNSFLPTLSPEFKHGQNGAVAYFHHFLEKNPFGAIIEEQVQDLGENAYLHSGMYDFEVGPSDNRSVAHARFSYVWVKEDDGVWRIAHHHSSLKPQG